MTREEAIKRIKIHMLIHRMAEDRAVYITEALNMAIEALETQSQKWIPVSKMLPEEDGEYLCQEWSGFYYVDSFNSGEWSLAKEANAKCIAWMPLPEPYTEEEE